MSNKQRIESSPTDGARTAGETARTPGNSAPQRNAGNDTCSPGNGAPQHTSSDGAPRPNPLNRRTFALLVALCLASLAGHLLLLPHMPAQIPTHWDSAGNVNGWTGREAIIVLDALPLLITVMMYLLPSIDPRGRAYARMGSFYTGFVTLFTLFMIGITWTSELTVFGMLPASGSPVGAIVSMVLGVGLVLLGNYMPKIKRNYTFGCKTPWALDNDANWRLTHRFCGVAFVLSGLVIAGASIWALTSGSGATAVILVSVLGSSIATYLYSYLVFRNGNAPLRSR